MTGASFGSIDTIAVARLDRWSPRAFSGEEISEDALAGILDAARWAPNAASNWHLLYARRSSPHWSVFLELLSDFNESWTKQAGALLLVVSDPLDAANPTRVFDAATAVSELVLQAKLDGWQAQALVGFDSLRAIQILNIPGGYSIATAVAIGRHGLPRRLPPAVRQPPSNRRSLTDIAFEGGFPAQ